ncbi:Ribulose-phosphate 3-epimerase, partial [termite gut metagenome]
LKDIVQDVYMVLVMSVNPGFGGQKFIEHSIEKVKELRNLIESTNSKALIEVDGGINVETGARLMAAGANVLVVGSTIFKAENPEKVIRDLKNL